MIKRTFIKKWDVRNKIAFIVFNCALSPLYSSHFNEELSKDNVLGMSSIASDLALKENERGEREVFKHILGKIAERYGNEVSPKCFLSYAWSNVERNQNLLARITKNLRKAGVSVITDQDNFAGTHLGRFMDQVADPDTLVILAGSLELMRKYQAKQGLINNELALIQKKLNHSSPSWGQERGPIIPILLDKSSAQNLLPAWLLLTAHLDFSDETQYYNALLKLVRSIYNIPLSDKNFKKLEKDFLAMKKLLHKEEYKEREMEKQIRQEAKARRKLEKIFLQKEDLQIYYERGKQYQQQAEATGDLDLFEKAASYYQLAAQQNHEKASFKQGLLYHNGHIGQDLSVEEREKIALDFYSKASSNSFPSVHQRPSN